MVSRVPIYLTETLVVFFCFVFVYKTVSQKRKLKYEILKNQNNDNLHFNQEFKNLYIFLYSQSALNNAFKQEDKVLKTSARCGFGVVYALTKMDHEKTILLIWELSTSCSKISKRIISKMDYVVEN